MQTWKKVKDFLKENALNLDQDDDDDDDGQLQTYARALAGEMWKADGKTAEIGQKNQGD